MNCSIIRRVLALVAALLLVVGCAANPALEESRKAFATGHPEAALRSLQDKVSADPKNLELRAYFLRQRDTLILRQVLAADQARIAGRFDEAERALAVARPFDPRNPRVIAAAEAIGAQKQRKLQMEDAERRFSKGDLAGAEAAVRAVLAADPSHPVASALMRRLDERAAALDSAPLALAGPFSKLVSLEFRDAPLRGVFEALSRASGLNFVMDRDVRPDIKVTLFVRDNSIDDVIKLLMVTQQLERKLLNGNSVLIYPNTPVKQKDYQELVTRSFFLANADPKQAMAMIKQMVKTRDVFVEEKLNLLVMKDTPAAVRLAERLVADLDLAEPEVMLDVEVLEVSRNTLLELGTRFPDQIGYGQLQPTTTSSVTTPTGTTLTQSLGGQLLQGNINLRQTGELVPFVANPGLLLNLKDQDGNSNILANPRIRVKNRDKAKIHIGEKLPVFTTTSTANVGVSSSVNYLDVGLKLEVEPSVHLDDEVAIKVNLEVSSIAKEVTGPAGSLAYQVGTRSAITSLRLRDGETQVLAGLISDEERSSANRLPGLGELPGVGRLFSSQRDVGNKTEIVLLITPRILRNIAKSGSASPTQAAGTESTVGALPLLIGATRAGALGLKSPAGAALPPAVAQALVASAAAPTGVSASVEGVRPALRLEVPDEVHPGEEFAVTVTLESVAGEGCSLQMGFDSSLVDIVDGQSERGDVVVLQLPAGPASSLAVRFRARPGVVGRAGFSLLSAQGLTPGQGQAVLLPAPGGVQIVP